MSGELIWQGMDYPGVATVIRMMGHKGQKASEVFADIQIMEAAALPALNKRK